MNKIKGKRPVLFILSGGLDSTSALHLTLHDSEINIKNSIAISFDYGQKQIHELSCAADTCKLLGLEHRIIKLHDLTNFLGEVSANVGEGIQVPALEQVLGDPQPATYVPNRNMIMFSIAASIAECRGIERIACGIQTSDVYGYWDSNEKFVSGLNDLFAMNRKSKIILYATLGDKTKEQIVAEIIKIKKQHIFENTFSCYDPQIINEKVKACGICATCMERKNAFKKNGIEDPVSYIS